MFWLYDKNDEGEIIMEKEVLPILSSPRTMIEMSELENGAHRRFTIKAVENDAVLGEVKFQSGELINGLNGIFIEDLLEITVQHLKQFQDSEFRCRENACALTHVEEAQMWLEKRRKNRMVRGVEGTHKI
jgi:hypothetical protein